MEGILLTEKDMFLEGRMLNEDPEAKLVAGDVMKREPLEGGGLVLCPHREARY